LTHDASILDLVLGSDGRDVRALILEELQSSQRTLRVVESDLKGYHGHKPGWIAERICCLLTVAEICRMVTDREPALLAVKETLKTHSGGKRLVAACGSARKSQGFCQ